MNRSPTHRAATIALIAALAGALAGCAATMNRPPAPVAADPTDPVASLAWLAGAWKGGEGNATFEEHWTGAAGGTMFGANRTIRDGQTAAFEFLRIAMVGPNVVYFAAPGGRNPPTPFRMTESGPDRVVFANLDHDFPRRIIYERRGEVLHVRIEGEIDGAAKSSEWTYRRQQPAR